jgi:NAD(P)-dependent dehydrogenase (short-subunit alcohol dehydrogenase family)
MKSIFITGANRGLGRGFVDHCLGQGLLVFAGARDVSNIKPQPGMVPVRIDISDDDSIFSAFRQIKEHTVTLDFLVNNAAINKNSASNGHIELACNLKDLDRKVLLKMFEVNAISPLLVLKRFLPLLNGDPSYVINISAARASYHDEIPESNGNYGYKASKTALNMLTYCTLWDIPQKVRIFSVHPGRVKTDMNPTGNDDPKIQAGKILGITEKWKKEFNGKFLRYDGTLYPL